MSFEINPEFKRKLEEKSRPRNVSLPELMPSKFMRKNTNFQNIQEMFDKCEFADVSHEEIKSVLESDAWNVYVKTSTRFVDWQEMVKAAGIENMQKH